ncbi:hypothetical protein DPMN_036243 [Dreissena polymorpha]|uniref:Uncharacterized protein n=1 Tax=Dreissena polymorpha TaxID=45954 RepID=A0A9D4MAK7_DREPO|nr:hypothetical protein DPMN_036243 [Dreissena polymorpha]
MNSVKRTLSSTDSETSTNTSLLETSVFEKGEKCESSSQVKKYKEKIKTRLEKTMTTFVTSAQNENRDKSEMTIEKRLDDISSKLSHVLTKEDSSFIKDIIKETVEQLKDQLLGNVIRRIEILESDAFEQKSKNRIA